MRPPAQAYGLSRQSTGLSEPHKQLIRLLAERAVEQYLAETEAGEATQTTDETHEGQR